MWSKMKSKSSSLGIVILKKSGSQNETKRSVNQPQVRIQAYACLKLNKTKGETICKDLLTRSQPARPLEISSPNDVDYVVSLVIKY